jgi:GT2 family glycosyltransferase
LVDALAAIESVRRPQDETIVVDSASRDDSVRRVAGAVPGVRVLRADRPGASRARNLAAASTSADVLCFTDDDCRPQPGWVEAIEAAFEAEGSVGFVTGKVLSDRDRGPTVSVLVDDSPRSFSPGDDPAGVGHGANLAVRRSAFEAVGGFDDALGAGAPLAGAEDQDLVWRLLRAGWAGRYEPRAVMVHRQWRSRSQYLRVQYAYGLGSGALTLKMIRIAGRPAREVLTERLWRRGVMRGLRALREGNETGAVGTGVHVVGSVVGLVRARRLALEHDRFLAD